MFTLLVVAAPSYLSVYAGGRTAPSHHLRTGRVVAVVYGLVSVATAVLLYLADGDTETALLGAIGVFAAVAAMYFACEQLEAFEKEQARAS